MSSHFYHQLSEATRLLCTHYDTIEHRIYRAVTQHLHGGVMDKHGVHDVFLNRREKIIAAATSEGEVHQGNGRTVYKALMSDDGKAAQNVAEEIWRLHRDVTDFREYQREFPDSEPAEEMALCHLL